MDILRDVNTEENKLMNNICLRKLRTLAKLNITVTWKMWFVEERPEEVNA